MHIIGFMIACILINQYEWGGAWYLIAFLAILGDFVLMMVVGSASAQAGLNHVIKKTPGIRGAINGGKNG
jgi:hypothetical protein